MQSHAPHPVVLAILDGWGHSDLPDKTHNAIAQARTPNLDALSRQYPTSFLDASELHVGLPEGQMGNSEVGHMNIGGGRVVMQDLPRIDAALAGGALANHPEMRAFLAALKKSGGACHVLGLLSPGGVHSHQRHMAALARAAADAGIEVRVHAFLDGRDTPPQSACDYIRAFEQATGGSGGRIRIATVCGRYYAMDRDHRWERVKLAYEMLAEGDGAIAANAVAAVEASYAQNKSDEFVLPAVLTGYDGMRDGDGLLMANFRADRAREILSALLDPDFSGFLPRRKVAFAAALGVVEYSTAHNAWMKTLFPPLPLTHMLGEVVAGAGLKQLRIAETEKYAHVTFFFNGGREEAFEGETRILVPSPKVATYDLKPEMSAFEVTEKLVDAIQRKTFDFIVVNYANGDMVGHSGDLEAARRAVEAVDTCLGRVYDATQNAGGVLLITADHGNAEQMLDQTTGQAHTAHTLNKVPFTILGAGFERERCRLRDGILADIAPTVLAIMGLPQPKEMTGKPLFALRA